MDSRQTCKICSRSFANGKAMGGHMRSHLAKLRVPPKQSKPPPPPTRELENPTSKSQSSSLSSSSNIEHAPNKPPSKSASYYTSKPSLDGDEESEIESPRSPTRRRSKRPLKSNEKVAEPAMVILESLKQVTSESNRFSVVDDADAALWLVMLSHGHVSPVELDSEINKQPELGKYRCEACRKSFRSYQALGGHKANHKKIKRFVAAKNRKPREGYRSFPDKRDEDEESSDSSEFCERATERRRRLFNCPYCDRVFKSGEALGGHKRVHFVYLRNATSSGKSTCFFDLNLPAPEVAETEVTLVELAAQARMS
ncbi:hypothetical protein K2173_013064 [Erythroxylum novogranatense]|uniref:C2H2-type domain-containing protein n=1 Tax=Erythroxylum novogranatense TaxID=1862640 RepID=A0AAV8S6U9_9ROSI|nr:hypothetical protein K2173_013064 [Erythroxylum novogranatense]